MTIAVGAPIIIHSTKSISLPNPEATPAAMALGGLPMMVPMPPTEAAIGMATIRALAKGSLRPSCRTSGSTAPIIKTVVEVLEMNIDATPLVIITASSTIAGRVPAGLMASRNRWRSSPVRDNPSAMKKPPSISQITGLDQVLR